MELTNNQTPREIVEELDKYIVGQKNLFAFLREGDIFFWQ